MSAHALYVLILAGGSGERFWPLSRKNRPKQLLSLFSKETLLEATLRRLDGLVPPAQILILTNEDQEAAVRALCPQLPAENIVAHSPCVHSCMLHLGEKSRSANISRFV